MIKNILGCDFKYENDKMYRLNKRTNEWSCLNDNKPMPLYIRIVINDKKYLLHRIIYKYFNPDWDITDTSTNNYIDHKDQNKLNNKIENLRVFNNSQNQRNKNKKSNCSSKYTGVNKLKNDKKWRARISINGISQHLGLFDTEEEAYNEYKKKYDELMN